MDYTQIIASNTPLNTVLLPIKSLKLFKIHLSSLYNTRGGHLFWGLNAQHNTRELFSEIEINQLLYSHDIIIKLLFPRLTHNIQVEKIIVNNISVLMYKVPFTSSGEKIALEDNRIFIRDEKGLINLQCITTSFQEKIAEFI
jgi:predicted HTH transcriptional regulator